MANDILPLPADPGTIGRREAAASRTEDSITKYWPRVIVENRRVGTGTYIAHTGAHVVLAAAQAAGVGFWYLFNPAGSTFLVALRRIEFMSQLGTVLATPTSPRLLAKLFTFTGTHTGALITPGKQRASYPTPGARLSTASTGATITEGAEIFSFLPMASYTAVNGVAASSADWTPDTDGMPVLGAGEGVMFKQPDAGTAADTRRFVTNIAWEEFTEF